jgi:hypothetical protein
MKFSPSLILVLCLVLCTLTDASWLSKTAKKIKIAVKKLPKKIEDASDRAFREKYQSGGGR